ncbi:hypothetical protein VMUT_0866 [Vulcanisaeta moutnovskia 768-28]|uniref:Uncharacterized protein n=1 Tax=Vulcanisaeta moutnovskia (strain 768-28) TaxID=985053 RepID=F0QWV8_VULM7|nr:hypothetical protein [Vulcanisaeta moutnovskia]ADY01076.1 hypothetical protein VMUT_0866 [Vulcanisaeta moutnovskia 768-28]
MTVLDIGFGNAVWVRARVRIYESSRRVSDREYKVINAYIPLPTTIRYFGFRNGAPVKIWLFKDNRYIAYEGNIRRIHKSQYGASLPTTVIENLGLDNKDEIEALIYLELSEKEEAEETDEGKQASE